MCHNIFTVSVLACSMCQKKCILLKDICKAAVRVCVHACVWLNPPKQPTHRWPELPVSLERAWLPRPKSSSPASTTNDRPITSHTCSKIGEVDIRTNRSRPTGCGVIGGWFKQPHLYYIFAPPARILILLLVFLGPWIRGAQKKRVAKTKAILGSWSLQQLRLY